AEYDQKAALLVAQVGNPAVRRRIRQRSFGRLPRNTFSLDIPDWGLQAYADFPYFNEVATAKQGMSTGQTNRFLRFRWEVQGQVTRWFPHAKGGEYRRWSGNDYWAVDWELNGIRLQNFVDPATGNRRSALRNTIFYRRCGATWSSQTVSAFAVRYLEQGSCFDTTG